MSSIISYDSEHVKYISDLLFHTSVSFYHFYHRAICFIVSSCGSIQKLQQRSWTSIPSPLYQYLHSEREFDTTIAKVDRGFAIGRPRYYKTDCVTCLEADRDTVRRKILSIVNGPYPETPWSALDSCR